MGHAGNSLALYNITCAFCGETGNWELEHHAEKKKPNGEKTLNFDTYQCGNCAGYVLILWSGDRHGYGPGGLHDYKAMPWPLGLIEPPEHWPPAVRRHWKQAHDSLKNENFDAASVMARSSLQAALRGRGAKGKDLYGEIDDLASKGILPPTIQDWSHEVRELARSSAHPQPEDEEVSAEDATDVVQFLDYLMEYLYDLPKQIQDYRQRRKTAQSAGVQNRRSSR